MKKLKPVESLILTIRGSKVLIDADLAAIYRVETRALNQAVKRNSERFPKDFIFQLNAGEKLKVITNCDHLTQLRFTESCAICFHRTRRADGRKTPTVLQNHLQRRLAFSVRLYLAFTD